MRKLKFRQCLCEVCQNPKAKVTRLNFFLENKCEGVKALLDESVCVYEGKFAKLECVNRKCSCCGVGRVQVRLERELGDQLDQQIKWSKWEMVKMAKSSRMEKVSISGTIRACVTELVKELDSLCRHKFNSEWQRDQLQELKEKLPDDWAMATMDFAENFLSKFQDEPKVPTGRTSRLPCFRW